MNFPGIILAIMVMAALGPAEVNVILSITAFTSRASAGRARLGARAQDADFVDAARASGLSHWRILIKHILPHTPSRR